ncbi:hypothetical protein LIER_31586 [Lithospermum erythrorhizon]|uniref:Uncharacterized protein n=1 Tax=Lithospermum erythrorhizon TaxID=34254 RepID=A0AAV3RTB1_LITER
MWSIHPYFANLVDKSLNGENSPFPPLAISFADKALAWNKDIFGNIHRKVNHLTKRIGGVQKKLQDNPSHSLQNLEIALLQEYNEILKAQKLHWFVKSRVQWIQFGDVSTSFFHTSTVVRKHKNNIKMLKDSLGAWITYASHIASHITSHFSEAFTTVRSCSYSKFPFQPSFTPLLEASQLSLILNPITDDDILGALHSFKPYKSPGPDSLYPIFFPGPP